MDVDEVMENWSDRMVKSIMKRVKRVRRVVIVARRSRKKEL